MTVPKVLLFTNTPKGTPFVFKALSEEFAKTLQFGLVRQAEDALVKQYKVKTFPALFVIKNEQKPIPYPEKEFSYNKIFEFINVYSQIFVDPTAKENQKDVKTNAASKPWLLSKVPKLTKDSGNDICLKKDGSLCVILVAKDASTVNKNMLDELGNLGEKFESKISRGITFYFMWLDAAAEPQFTETFGLESYPQVVILNPGKRKRFTLHEGTISSANLEKTMDKILGGDAKFKQIKGNTLPALVSEYPQDEAKKTEL